MWYEILPAMGVILTAISLPHYASFVISSLFQNGNPYRRRLSPYFNRDLYLRDLRLSGNPYIIQGLDNIPDGEDGDGDDDDDDECKRKKGKKEDLKKVPIKIEMPAQQPIRKVLPANEGQSCINPDDIFKIPQDLHEADAEKRK